MYNVITLLYMELNMMAALIHLLEVTMVSLTAILIYRIRFLYLASQEAVYIKTEEPKLKSSKTPSPIFHRLTQTAPQTHAEYEVKMESLKQSQIFAGAQLLDIKRQYGDLHQDNLEWLREAISLYLIGAIDFIGSQSHCGAQSRKDLITLVLKSNLKLSTENTSLYFKEALYRQLSSDSDLMIRAGARAAKFWLSEKTVPQKMSLTANLDHWGVFA